MISVCMATYNGSKYIATQMNSILGQLAPNDEVIVQDDCSKDDTLEILIGLQDERIKILVNDVNQGVIPTFESALKRARGEIIFLSDQDDEWLPDKVVKVVNEFARPNVMAVVTDAVIVDGDGRVTDDSYFAVVGSAPGVLKNFIHNSYLGCCLAFRREVLQPALPIPQAIRTHDGWIGITANMLGDVVFLSTPLIKYKRHGSNASQMERFPIKDVVFRRILLATHILRVQPTVQAVRQAMRRKNEEEDGVNERKS